MSYVCITTANDADKLLAAFYLCCLSTTTLVVLIVAFGIQTLSYWPTAAAFLCPDHFSPGRSIFRRQKLDRAVHFLPRTHYRVTVQNVDRDYSASIRARVVLRMYNNGRRGFTMKE